MVDVPGGVAVERPGGAGEGNTLAGDAVAATPTPTPAVVVRSFSLAPPTATPKPLQALTVQITVYYDENNNRAPDINEGVAGLSVRALDRSTNQVMGQTFTDIYGHAILAVSAPGEVRLSMPYLGYNQAVKPPGKELFVRLTPLRLPLGPGRGRSDQGLRGGGAEDSAAQSSPHVW